MLAFQQVSMFSCWYFRTVAFGELRLTILRRLTDYDEKRLLELRRTSPAAKNLNFYQLTFGSRLFNGGI